MISVFVHIWKPWSTRCPLGVHPSNHRRFWVVLSVTICWLWFMVDITIVFMGFINQRSHHWGAPSCRIFFFIATQQGAWLQYRWNRRMRIESLRLWLVLITFCQIDQCYESGWIHWMCTQCWLLQLLNVGLCDQCHSIHSGGWFTRNSPNAMKVT